MGNNLRVYRITLKDKDSACSALYLTKMYIGGQTCVKLHVFHIRLQTAVSKAQI